jgi:O-antigen/teichoic acid export membrane protein
MTAVPGTSLEAGDSFPIPLADEEAEPRRDRLGLQFLWVSSGKIIAALLQAAIMLLLVREVSPAQFGFFSAAYGVITIPQTLLDLGLPTLIVRERARDARDGIVTAALKLNNLFSIALSALLLLTGLFLAVFVDAQYWLLLPFALWAAAERNADAWLGVVLADGDSWINVTNLVLRRVLSLGIFVGLSTWTATPPMLAIALAFAVAAALSWFFAHVYVSQRLVPSSRHTMSQLVAKSYPYWINSVSSQIQNLDVALTSAFAGPAQAGLYAAAARLTNPLRILPNSLATILLPAASKRTSSTIASLCKLVAGATAVFGMFYGALIVLMPWAVPVFLGGDYAGATFALQVTCAGLVFASASSLVSTLLLGLGLKHHVATTAVVTTFACLAGVVVGSITAGAAGAAIGLASAFVLQSLLLSTRLAVFVIRREPNR